VFSACWEENIKNSENVSSSQKAKLTLSSQTKEGIFLTIGDFTGAMKYLLSIGAKYVNARAFCRDPLNTLACRGIVVEAAIVYLLILSSIRM